MQHSQIIEQEQIVMRASIVMFLLFAAATPFSLAQQEGTNNNPDTPIEIWTAIFVDAETSVPLPGIIVDAHVSIPDNAKQQMQVLTSNDVGEIKLPLREGLCAFLNIRGPGWCSSSGLPVVGHLPAQFFDGDPPTRNPEKPITIKLYKGTDVRGRLLQPDGKPAADVTLHAGVHCGGLPWVSNNHRHFSYSTHDWPNWHASTTTGEDGSFSVTVPPVKSRTWIRLGTTRGGFQAIDTAVLASRDKNHPLVRYAPFSIDINGQDSPLQVDESSGTVELGKLRLSNGIVFRGHVVDPDGQPLSGVHLLTSSEHGPLAGRKTISEADGSFEFMPMNAGTFKLKPDAHVRDDMGKKKSFDVQAVFISQEVTLNEDSNPHELVVQALPHVDLEFEWIDRRAEKGPVAYYGCFRLTGRVPGADGFHTRWRGKTVKIARDEKKWLVVKVPVAVTNLKIALHPDQRVTPSYLDDHTEIASGHVLLSNFKLPMRRVIYGDEPKGKNQAR